MTIEAKLDELIEINRAILIAIQSGAAVTAPAAAPAEAPAKRGRKGAEKTEEPAAEAPKEQAPAAEVTASPAPTPETPAASEPSAPPAPATASEPTSAPTDEVAFAQVTEAIRKLNTDLNAQQAGKGRDAILDILTKFLGTAEGKRVPDLESAGKNAEIMAYVQSLQKAGEDDLGL